MAPPADTRPPAQVPPAVMLAAIDAYEDGAVLAFPDLDYRRLSHAIQAAIRAHAAIMAKQMVPDAR